jgi:hypothetical protein
MKLRHEDIEVLSNTNNERKFTINATAKAFRILSDSLYSRKIEAIVRELSCNAYDSHVMAGCPEKPFSIHFPNEWEPEFSVEDFGVGLSKDDVESIYTSYFTSTKTNSNDVIGALGLGSKTPFAYTDTFNIRSRKDGVELHYNAFINASGEPSVSLMSEKPTTEGNGVKISLPVRKADFYQFKEDARKVYQWFTVLPEMNIDLDISRGSFESLEGKRYTTSGNRYNSNQITAVMGNVAYIVSRVRETFEEELTLSEKKFFENQNLIIRFDIGDLDVAVSRETISFDDETREVFVNKVKECIKDMTASVQTYVDSGAISVVDACDYVEREIGSWAYDLFTFKGISLAKWRDSNWGQAILDTLKYELMEIDAVQEDGSVVKEQENVEDLIWHNFYGAQNNLSSTIREVRLGSWGMYFAKLNKYSKFVFYTGNVDGVFAAMKEHAKSKQARATMLLYRDISQTTKDELTSIFGNVEFIDAQTAVDERKARIKEQRRLAALARKEALGDVPGVTTRKPLNLFRTKYTLTVDGPYISKDCGVLVDPADLVGKRVLILEDSRGHLTLPWNDNDSGNGIVYTRDFYLISYNIDIAIVVTPSQVKYAFKAFQSVNAEVETMFKNRTVLNDVMIKKYYLKEEVGYYFMTSLFGEHVLKDRIYDEVIGIHPEVAEYREIHEGLYGVDIDFYFKRNALGSIVKQKINDIKDTIDLIKDRLKLDYPLLEWLCSTTPKDELDRYIELVDKSKETV